MPRLKRIALVVVLAGCARQGLPPGGQPRFTPPVLLATSPPDSICNIPGFRGDAVFQFDEVISEGSQANFGFGTGDLERLTLLSPDTAVPVVRWRRDRITVHPRNGWQPNTAYRIELAPGIADLWRNITKKGAVIRFGTGDQCPARTLSGRAIDWAARRGIPAALIDAIHLPDSLGYRTVADSSGRFHLDRLPDGYYLVRATIDANHDQRSQMNEAWDTVRVAAGIDTVGEIWAFARDTLPPKIQSVARADSQAIAVTFTKPIDPTQRLDSTSIRALLIISPTDSGTIGPVAAYPKTTYDSLYPPAPPQRPKADTTGKKPPSDTAAVRAAALRDSLVRDSLARDSVLAARRRKAVADSTAAKADLPEQKRSDLGTILVIRTLGRVQFGKRYFIELRDVRLAGGRTGPPATYIFTTPKAPSDTTHADSTGRAHADSGKGARPDTTGGKAGVRKP